MGPAQLEQFRNAFIGVVGPSAPGLAARGGRERQLITRDFLMDTFKAIMDDMGYDVVVRVWVDSSWAKSIAS